MLKNISPILPPDLLKYLAEMGHGDTIVLADGNFPGASVAKRIVRCDGIGVPALLSAVLKLMPLEACAEQSAAVMAVPADIGEPVIWAEFRGILAEEEPAAGAKDLRQVERFAFYEEAKQAYVVVQSGELATYANLILQKGVLT